MCTRKPGLTKLFLLTIQLGKVSTRCLTIARNTSLEGLEGILNHPQGLLSAFPAKRVGNVLGRRFHGKHPVPQRAVRAGQVVQILVVDVESSQPILDVELRPGRDWDMARLRIVAAAAAALRLVAAPKEGEG